MSRIGLRLNSTRTALRKALRIQSRIGVSRLANLTDFYDVGVQVTAATRPAVSDFQNTSVQGKGWTFDQAACGALMEAVERYCASLDEPVDSSGKFIPELKEFKYKTDPGLFPAFPVIQWRTQEKYKIPAAEVLFPYKVEIAKALGVVPHTTGLSAGGDLTEAVLFGLFELIERQASSVFYCGAPRTAIKCLIDPATVGGERTSKLIARLNDLKFSLVILELNALIPTYFIYLLDTSGLTPGIPVNGRSSHVEPAAALEGALLEAAQALVVSLQGSREDLRRHDANYGRAAAVNEALLSRLRAAFPPRPFINSCAFDFRSAEDLLPQLIQRVEDKTGANVYAADLTQPEIPFSVAKVIAPGLFDFFINSRLAPHSC